jgi:hypothetical protein
MGGPLSEAERKHGIDIDWAYEAIRCKCDAAFVENDIEALSLHLQDVAREEATARVGVLEGQLATARGLHQMERRYTDESYETSYDTRQEAAEALGITPGAAVYLDVCSHCGSMEMDAGSDDYKDSLWPCDTAKALGLDGGGSDE